MYTIFWDNPLIYWSFVYKDNLFDNLQLFEMYGIWMYRDKFNS